MLEKFKFNVLILSTRMFLFPYLSSIALAPVIIIIIIILN